ncbi:MAG: hypothetical protein P8P74_15680 [Crocinitomicaceae bacterium]|nr:hypothetical protein [Crocinitomicaceae bacterium]
MIYTFKGNFGTLLLTVDTDGKARGTYQKNGVLEGDWSENSFSGEWTNQGMEGLVRFTVSDGKLEGNWKKGKDVGAMKGRWKGDLLSKEDDSETTKVVEETTSVANTPAEHPLKAKIEELYDAEDYASVITLFSENETELSENEDIVHKYLFSMWFHGDLEEETFEKIRGFEDKFETNRWLKLKGFYYSRKKWYDSALEAFKDTSERHYLLTKKKFDDYYTLHEEEKYSEVVKYFESELRSSISSKTFKVAEIYCQALYMDSDTERKALEKIRTFRERYPEHQPFTKLNGRFANYIGGKDLNLELIEEGLACFKEIKDERNIAKTKELIGETKSKIKAQTQDEKAAARERAAAEKKAAREAEAARKRADKKAVAAAKLLQHRFKNSRGLRFCQFCGREQQWATETCEIRGAGHNFVLLKERYSGELTPTCNKCGQEYNWAGDTCE